MSRGSEQPTRVVGAAMGKKWEKSCRKFLQDMDPSGRAGLRVPLSESSLIPIQTVLAFTPSHRMSRLPDAFRGHSRFHQNPDPMTTPSLAARSAHASVHTPARSARRIAYAWVCPLIICTMALPARDAGAQPERRTLSGSTVSIYNVVGRVRVSSSRSRVVAEMLHGCASETASGADAIRSASCIPTTISCTTIATTIRVTGFRGGVAGRVLSSV